ncbi:hypothetical protein [Halococcus sp. AFM35]|uniref:hypothetical protein n=1 Tax=Halococcus sp. AFM35 TaxID=3421653 RepID=UPI003EBAAE9E
MTERRRLLPVVAVVAILLIAGFGGGFTLARMSDTETKQVSVAAGTWTTTPETPMPPEHAISFAAFCVADGTDAPASAVTITNVVRDDEGEPFGITYESTVELSTVVLKGSQTVENFPGGTGDTVYFGSGTSGTADQTPSEPCPNGETVVVKFEYNEDSGEFVPEIEDESSGSDEDIGAQSLEATANETVGANEANTTSPTASIETTAGAATTETPTATPAPISTDTETATPTEGSATETSVPMNETISNESTGTDGDG